MAPGTASRDRKNRARKDANLGGKDLIGGVWWARKDLNLGPMDYESTALTAELRALPQLAAGRKRVVSVRVSVGLGDFALLAAVLRTFLLPCPRILTKTGPPPGARCRGVLNAASATGSEEGVYLGTKVVRRKLSDRCLHRFITAGFFSRNCFGSRNYNINSGSRTV